MCAIAAEMIAAHAQTDVQTVHTLLASETGHATPKIDVRGVVFRDDAILLVKERQDGLWTLPGGWADVNESPSEAVVREVLSKSRGIRHAPSNCWPYMTAASMHIRRICIISTSYSSVASYWAAPQRRASKPKRWASFRRMHCQSSRSCESRLPRSPDFSSMTGIQTGQPTLIEVPKQPPSAGREKRPRLRSAQQPIASQIAQAVAEHRARYCSVRPDLSGRAGYRP
jgi:NUDIX domain